MAVKVGVIKNILGSKEVVVIDKNGNERVVVAGDSLYEGDIVKANGAKVTIASNDGKEFELKDGETLNLNNDLSSDKEVAAIQKALLKGENLANLEESAAGGNSGGRGGDGVSLGETRFEHGGHESSNVTARVSDPLSVVPVAATYLTNSEVKGGSSENLAASSSQASTQADEIVPAPQPELTPEPAPQPKPEPTPEPTPDPKPIEPVEPEKPQLKPEPKPVEPEKPTPEPQPEPTPTPEPTPKPEPTPQPTPNPNGTIVSDLRVETITKEVSEKPGNDSYLEYGIRANVDKANADKMLKVFFGFGGKADHGKDYDNVEYSIDGKNWELLPLKDYSATINVKAGDINNLTVRARVLDDDRLNEGKFDPTNKIYKNAEGIEGNGEYKESVTLIVEVDDTITSADEYIVDNDREVTIPIGYHSTNPFDIEFAGDGRNILKIKYGHSMLGSLDQEGTNKINFGDEKLSGKDELSAESVNLIKTDINTYGGDDVINIRSSYNLKEVNADMGAGNDVLGLSILDNSVGNIENSKFKLGSGSNTVNIGGAELKDVILDMSSDDKDAVNTINFDFGDYMNVIDKPARFTSTTPKDVYDIDVSSAHNTLNLGWAYLDGVTIGSNRSEKGTLDIKGDIADLKGVNIESGNNETHIDIDYARINYRAPGQPDQEVKSSEWNLSPYNDTIKIDEGFINKLKVNLGAGDDNVFLSMKTNNSSLQMDGGDGYDVATIEDYIGGYNNKFKGFEELRITGNEAYRIGTRNVFINDVLQDDNNHTIDVYLSKISQANGGVKLYEKYHKADGAEEGYQRYEFKNENFTDDSTGEKYTQTIHVDIKNDIHVDL